MKPSILQLEEYFFTETKISLSRFFKPDKEIQISAEQIDCQIKSGYIKEKDFYFIELVFKLDAVKHRKINIPYNISLSIAGKVSVSPDYKEDKERIAVINGASLLYSAVREHLLYLTSRYPFGSIIIPTVNFNGLRKNPILQSKKN